MVVQDYTLILGQVRNRVFSQSWKRCQKKSYTGTNQINSAKKPASSGDRTQNLLSSTMMPC